MIDQRERIRVNFSDDPLDQAILQALAPADSDRRSVSASLMALVFSGMLMQQAHPEKLEMNPFIRGGGYIRCSLRGLQHALEQAIMAAWESHQFHPDWFRCMARRAFAAMAHADALPRSPSISSDRPLIQQGNIGEGKSNASFAPEKTIHPLIQGHVLKTPDESLHAHPVSEKIKEQIKATESRDVSLIDKKPQPYLKKRLLT
jgi:hypothetical protein